MMKKISKERLQILKDDLDFFEEFYIQAKKDYEEFKIAQIMPSCPDCEGTGEKEFYDGIPAHDPMMDIQMKDCETCQGKGYVEEESLGYTSLEMKHKVREFLKNSEPIINPNYKENNNGK